MNTGIVRKGKVSSINPTTREVRVYFPDDDFVSGWLKVLKNSPFMPTKDDEQKTEEASSHYHKVQITPWFPSVNDIVVCIYESGFNGDGYVLGAL